MTTVEQEPESQGGEVNDHGLEAQQERWSPDEAEEHGEAIASLAGQIAAATARLLAMIGEFDARSGWAAYAGVRSCVHWLSWRTGLDLRTAREQLRVARALRELPLTAAAFAKGELSYSKVRAISRVATPQIEQDLVSIAKAAPAAHIERLTRGLMKAATYTDEAAAVLAGQHGRAGRSTGARWYWDDDTGHLVLTGRFSAADGATVLAALTRAEQERLRTRQDEEADVVGGEGRTGEGPGGSEGDTPTADEHRHENEDWQTQPDLTGPPPADPAAALVALAQMALTGLKAPVHAPAAEVILLHGPAELTTSGATDTHHHTEWAASSAPDTASATRWSGDVKDSPDTPEAPDTAQRRTGAGSGRAREAGAGSRLPKTTRVPGGPAMAAEAALEAMCGSAYRAVAAKPGVILKYGTKRRTVSQHQLRALLLRDGGCVMPGCGRTRFLHAHHVRFHSRGGPTDLDNLILLCGSCHRAVHTGAITITAHGRQRFTFHAPDGAPVRHAPAATGGAEPILASPRVEPDTISGRWGGEPLNLPEATGFLLESWIQRAARETGDAA